jgi:8-oxo-dGTP pyrophosphatase MutT (NUDIX family)
MSPVPPVDAATVVLARQTEPAGSGWECFMVRRHVRSDFAADVFVFPGGKVDPADRDMAVGDVVTESPEFANPANGGDVTERALRIAAIRELFEEAGVLIAQTPDGNAARLEGDAAGRFAEYRRRMQAGTLSMIELARGEGLQYPVARLHAISRWITPESFPRRFDTRFFLTAMPEGQIPIHDTYETTESIWIAPAEALRRYQEGTFPLVFATEKHLERMAKYGSINALATSVTARDLDPVVPKPVEIDGETHFLLPGDDGY